MDIALSPNWSPLLLVLLLGVVCTFLYLAMQRQMKRMHANWAPHSPTSASSAGSAASPDSADRPDPDVG